MKALVTATFTDEGLDRLRSHMEVLYEPWTRTGDILRFEELSEKVATVGADALVVEVDLVHGDVFETADLKFIGCARGDPLTIGLDQATGQGIPVLFTPGRNADAVADLALGLMLDLARGLFRTLREVHSGSFRPLDPGDMLKQYDAMRGRELGGMTVGLIGLGAVGVQVARRLTAFGSRILVHDPFATDEILLSTGSVRAELDELLAAADIVSLHCPSNDQTRGMLDAEKLGLLKSDAFLVNTARADVIVEQALFEVLESKSIGGAALDVSHSEPIDPEDRLLALDNVLVTPHIGGATIDVVRHQSDMITADVDRLFQGARPKYLANPDVWSQLGSPWAGFRTDDP